MGQCGSEVRSAEVNQGSGGCGWNELSSKMEPGKDGGCSWGALYRERWRGEGSGRESSDRRWVFIAVHLKPERRGRGDVHAPIYEGKRGSTCSASARLQLSAKRRLMAARDAEN
jgi:hypothetical protein